MSRWGGDTGYTKGYDTGRVTTKAWERHHPNFTFVFLPTYSPQLQPIEGLFSVLQREFLDNYWWNSVDEIHQAIITWKYFYNTDRRTIHPRLPYRPRASRVLYTPNSC